VALGHFTRRKLKKLTTWIEWEVGEHKQLDQLYGQKMFGDAIDHMLLPKQAVVLQPYWKYIVKRSGVRRSRLCCNGSKMAAPQLHALANT
jgi:ferric iron reductase protein FhuF